MPQAKRKDPVMMLTPFELRRLHTRVLLQYDKPFDILQVTREGGRLVITVKLEGGKEAIVRL